MAKKPNTGANRNKRPKRPVVQTERYNIKTLHEDREYGMYWYAWLWKIVRPVMIFMCAVLIVIGMTSMGYNWVYEHYFGPVDAGNASVTEFEIESGSSVTAIGQKLEDAGLIRSDSVFRYMVQFQGLTEKLSYGTFELSPSMTVAQVVTELTSGSQTNERVITIVPGWTCEDIARYLVSEGVIKNSNEFLTLCNDVDRFVGESYALRSAQDAGALNGRKYALEGYLAPDTYRIFRSATPTGIITTLLAQDNNLIDRIYYNTDVEYRVDEEGEYVAVETYERDLSMDGYIILASMIEKEAGKESDYGKVSAVFHNRLKRGMKLESDPTATYLSGLSHYVLSNEEIADANLYNTYVVDGLPVGPICNPSAAALRAAIYPDMDYIEQGYLYFCATNPGSGELVFAVTEEQHRANVDMYHRLWEQYDAEHKK